MRWLPVLLGLCLLAQMSAPWRTGVHVAQAHTPAIETALAARADKAGCHDAMTSAHERMRSEPAGSGRPTRPPTRDTDCCQDGTCWCTAQAPMLMHGASALAGAPLPTAAFRLDVPARASPRLSGPIRPPIA